MSVVRRLGAGNTIDGRAVYLMITQKLSLR